MRRYKNVAVCEQTTIHPDRKGRVPPNTCLSSTLSWGAGRFMSMSNSDLQRIQLEYQTQYAQQEKLQVLIPDAVLSEFRATKICEFLTPISIREFSEWGRNRLASFQAHDVMMVVLQYEAPDRPTYAHWIGLKYSPEEGIALFDLLNSDQELKALPSEGISVDSLIATATTIIEGHCIMEGPSMALTKIHPAIYRFDNPA